MGRGEAWDLEVEAVSVDTCFCLGGKLRLGNSCPGLGGSKGGSFPDGRSLGAPVC